MTQNFINKYAPTSKQDIIGSINEVTKLDTWLEQFQHGIENKKFNTNTVFLIGEHGIGKKTIVKLLFKHHGYTPIVLTSSNLKENKNLVNDMLKTGKSSVGFCVAREKYAIILTDSENITHTNELNMLKQLCKTNEQLSILPIVIISDLQHSTFVSKMVKKYTSINLQKPTIPELLPLLVKVCNAEQILIVEDPGKKTIRQIFEILIQFADFDVRKILMILEDLLTMFGPKHKITYQQIKTYLHSSQNAVKNIGLLNGTQEVLNGKLDIQTIMDIYMCDKTKMPPTVFENYYRAVFSRNYDTAENQFKTMAKICETASFGDVIETSVFIGQNWYLQKIRGIITCCETSHTLSKFPAVKTHDIKFARDLNKTSLRNINKTAINTTKRYIKKDLSDVLLFSKLVNSLYEIQRYELLNKIYNYYGYPANDFKDFSAISRVDKSQTVPKNGAKQKKIISA